ncbi:hypothetical protein [Peptostreptococcus porci]|uniref:hypothetical protein n=1 Tax=Peptostreptococcus porci TaxID=2652282 RepID=UPI002A90E934|nr:hypothetical protein [Peptostreptococcus porci]MDY5437474.1 hypothetical protein [Peptostreptococcus porci]
MEELTKYLYSRYNGIHVTTERLTSHNYASNAITINFDSLFNKPYCIVFRLKDEELNCNIDSIIQKIDYELKKEFKRKLYK